MVWFLCGGLKRGCSLRTRCAWECNRSHIQPPPLTLIYRPTKLRSSRQYKYSQRVYLVFILVLYQSLVAEVLIFWTVLNQYFPILKYTVKYINIKKLNIWLISNYWVNRFVRRAVANCFKLLTKSKLFVVIFISIW